MALPGDLLHIDTKRFQRFTRPGHAKTGDRRRTGREKRMGVGHEFVHSIVDDHSRLAYSERHPDERAPTVTGFVLRALGFYERHGIAVSRLMSDNHFSYTRNRSLRELLAERGIRHLLIDPYRPQTNRVLADRLHTGAGAIYWHVAGSSLSSSPCWGGLGRLSKALELCVGGP